MLNSTHGSSFSPVLEYTIILLHFSKFVSSFERPYRPHDTTPRRPRCRVPILHTLFIQRLNP
jgi:hypothetical protein